MIVYLLADEEEYEMHLTAIIEDVNNLDGVLNAKLSDDGSVIVISDGITKKNFEDSLEPFLKRDFCS